MKTELIAAMARMLAPTGPPRRDRMPGPHEKDQWKVRLTGGMPGPPRRLAGRKVFR